MSKFMMIAGIVFAAIGVALGLMVFFSPGAMQVLGLTPEVSAIFLVGGVLAMGVGGLIGAVQSGSAPRAHAAEPASPIPEFGARPVATEELSPAVSETIKALEQAKTDLKQAFGDEAPAAAVVPPVQEAPATTASKKPDQAEPASPDTQLYVVEERTIRKRPARILSDGTVEAETEEGWMRFENLEHLDEYLDAMAPSQKV